MGSMGNEGGVWMGGEGGGGVKGFTAPENPQATTCPNAFAITLTVLIDWLIIVDASLKVASALRIVVHGHMYVLR